MPGQLFCTLDFSLRIGQGCRFCKKKFGPIRSLLSTLCVGLHYASWPVIGPIFFLQNQHPWPILRLKSRVQKSPPGVISDFFPQKTYFSAYTDQFFSMGLLETFHNEHFLREKFWYRCSWWVTVWKFPILRCLFLIGGGNQVNDQYGKSFRKWYNTW